MKNKQRKYNIFDIYLCVLLKRSQHTMILFAGIRELYISLNSIVIRSFWKLFAGC